MVEEVENGSMIEEMDKMNLEAAALVMAFFISLRTWGYINSLGNTSGAHFGRNVGVCLTYQLYCICLVLFLVWFVSAKHMGSL